MTEERVIRQLSPTGSTRWDLALVGLIATAIGLIVLWPMVDVSLGGDQYVFLAHRLGAGHLDVDNLPTGYGDYVASHGHKYLPFGPLPAILLVPLLPLLNIGMPMVMAGYIFSAINVVLFYRVLRAARISDERRHWATLLYFCGTPYLSVTLVGISTYFAHIVVTTFLLLGIWEALGRRRFLLVGLCLGLAASARLTALFAFPFFIWMLWSSGQSNEKKSVLPVRLAMLVLGLLVPLLLVFWYNYARFGNPMETGFGKAVLYRDSLYKARSVGLFSIAHIPKNLFMMLLQGPQPVGGDSAPVLRFPYIRPSQWGMGLFFTSPALVYVFRAPRRERLVQACWLATIATMIPLLTYYGIGYVQFGYRYALDFMPFLILLAALGFPAPMTPRARTLVAISVLINLWGAVTLAIWL
jgi:hypothetical protein